MEFKDLTGIDIIPAFNVTGNPVFKSITKVSNPTEGECAIIWRTYFASIVGNWLIESMDGIETESVLALRQCLESHALYEKRIEYTGWFSKICDKITNIRLKQAGVEFSANSSGIPTVTPSLIFDEKTNVTEYDKIAEIDKILGHIDRSLHEINATVWVILDRLDEAFDGYPAIETTALRALFRTYLDLKFLKNVKIKLFIRNDLFNKITKNGFVNLTHVMSNQLPITWDDRDLISLINIRLKTNTVLKQYYGADKAEGEGLVDAILPAKVDSGSKKPPTKKWILNRITDGMV